MQKTIKIQRILIAVLLIINIVISLLSYKLQIEYVAVIKENQKLKEIIEVKEDLKNEI